MTAESGTRRPLPRGGVLPPRSDGYEPGGSGWAAAATAIQSMQGMPLALVMRVTAWGQPPILVDPRYNAYAGGPDDAAFPESPPAVLVETQLVGPDAGPAFALPGRDLDALLWRIGLLAFPDRVAGWLTPGVRVRLQRWPNLMAMQHSFEDVSMAALLANSTFTVKELAEASGCSFERARSLVNALSLMGVLHVESDAPPVTIPASAAEAAFQGGASVSPEVTDAPPASPRQPTLLSRLRERFGI
ncbi:hypothetical protein [Homoserinimonas aerilata]|nr:hypothetical protein [Homoserinimonas aerilata]